MEYELLPNVWTFIGDTGVEIKYEGGNGPQTVRIDEQGAIVLPPIAPEEDPISPWMLRAGNVPVTREGQPFDLEHPEWWPGGFELVDGKWAVKPEPEV
jgi:hypothetical protein